MGYIGLQDATRKRRHTSQTLGEWNGSINLSLEGVGLFFTVSENNWNKSKEMIDNFLSQFASSTARPYFFLKDTEQTNGFSDTFGHGLPSDCSITKRSIYDD